MARIFCSGFEMRQPTSAALESLGGTGTSIDTGIFRSGSASMKLQLTSGVAGQFGMSTFFPTTGYHRFYIMVTARPASTARRIWGNTGVGSVNLRLNPDGTIAHFVNTTLTGTSSTALTDTTKWYRIETREVNGTSVPVLLIDGVTQVTASPSSWTLTATGGCGDTVADTYTAYFDDVAVDDATFPGDGKVVLLLPISDNARAALWTGGAGGTTDLFDAVNNTPPIGTATETNLTQIEHAGGAAGTTDAYDANMTSYTTAGLVAGDTVNLVQLVAVDGEDSGTGTKLLSYSAVSNPAIASTGNVSAGDDVAALGTYPSNWAKRQNIGLAASPSVTLGTSPVMRVVRPETASRVASVCFMGMYVDYTPAVADERVPRSTPYPQLLAH